MTSLVSSSYVKELNPIAFELCIGIILGGTSTRPFVFLLIVTSPSPNSYVRSTSGSGLFVDPSISISSGACV